MNSVITARIPRKSAKLGWPNLNKRKAESKNILNSKNILKWKGSRVSELGAANKPQRTATITTPKIQNKNFEKVDLPWTNPQ